MASSLGMMARRARPSDDRGRYQSDHRDRADRRQAWPGARLQRKGARPRSARSSSRRLRPDRRTDAHPRRCGAANARAGGPRTAVARPSPNTPSKASTPPQLREVSPMCPVRFVTYVPGRSLYSSSADERSSPASRIILAWSAAAVWRFLRGLGTGVISSELRRPATGGSSSGWPSLSSAWWLTCSPTSLQS